MGAERLGKGWYSILILFIVLGCLLAAVGTVSASDDDEHDDDDITVQKAEEKILKTGDELLDAAQMVGALEHYDLTATYNGVSIFTAYSELKLNYTALIWKFMDFKLYDIYSPEEAYRLAKKMKEEAEEIEDLAEDTLEDEGYDDDPIHEDEEVLVMGGLWLSRFNTALIAAFAGYSPTVAENTWFEDDYRPNEYEIIVLDEPCLWSAGRTSFRGWRRLEGLLGSDDVGVIFMLGAMSSNPYHADYGVFSRLFPNSFTNPDYEWGYNFTVRTTASAPAEFGDLDSTWDISDWGAWTFTLSPNLQNQKVILDLEWPITSNYGRPVAIAFTYGNTKLIASGLRSYLVKPWGEPEEREPVDWLYESPEYEEFLTASLDHVAPSE